MRWFLCGMALMSAASAGAAAGSSDLKLLISIDRPTVRAPFPARIILHFHNSGHETLWVYVPVRDASALSGTMNPLTTEDLGPSSTSGGSALGIHLVPVNLAPSGPPSEGRVLESAGLPHPKLLTIAPGEDYEEKTALRLLPASADQNGAQPLWGHYKLSLTYTADFSNGANLNRILGTALWEGKLESDSIEVALEPPSADAQASIGGSVVGADMQPVVGGLVTLSDQQEEVLDQSAPDEAGKFRFTRLPSGLYWVTARRRNASADAAVFRHVLLSFNEPAGTLQLVMLQPDVFQPQQLRHKPVLFRVFTADDRPAEGVTLEATWSSGTVLDNVKGRTEKDGAAALELIPGRNYVTLRRSGCPKQEERVDVAPGGGIDGFKLVFGCAKR